MKALHLTKVGKLEINEVPDPQINSPYDVLIKMKVVGVCGSDIHYFTTGRIGSQVVEYPFTLGHEGAGIVISTGEKVSHVKEGDLVAIEPAMSCYNCDQCKEGRIHTCENLRFLGCPGQSEGCLSEYIVMPEKNCLPVGKNTDAVQAALSEPLAIGMYAVKQSGNIQDKNIAILGFGPIGMSVLLTASLEKPAHILVTDKIDSRLQIAEKTGANLIINPAKNDVYTTVKAHQTKKYDVVYECCGKQEAIEDALKIIKPGGKLMIIGIPEFDHWQFSADQMRRKEITIINVRRQLNCTEEALDLIDSGRIDLDRMSTHFFSFKDSEKAFQLVRDYEDGVMKAIIEM